MPTVKPRAGKCPKGYILSRPMYLGHDGAQMGSEECTPCRRYWVMAKCERSAIPDTAPGLDFEDYERAKGVADDAAMHGTPPDHVWDSHQRRWAYTGRADKALRREAEKARRHASAAAKKADALERQAAEAEAAYYAQYKR